jgi:hypothetical protein
MILKIQNIMMAGMLLFSESILMPLYSSDDKREPGYNSCSDFVYISGQTNINHFNFFYGGSGLPIIDSAINGQLNIVIPVKDFVPSGPYMYNDFLVLLKENEYPFINISISKDQLDFTGHEFDYFIPRVNITIAGITRTYNLNCSVKKCSGGLLLMGNEDLKLSDFQLERMERLGGLIKLRDEISVSFGFIVNFTDNNSISSQR